MNLYERMLKTRTEKKVKLSFTKQLDLAKRLESGEIVGIQIKTGEVYLPVAMITPARKSDALGQDLSRAKFRVSWMGRHKVGDPPRPTGHQNFTSAHLALQHVTDEIRSIDVDAVEIARFVEDVEAWLASILEAWDVTRSRT